jgi:hypothetical protein
MASAAAASRFRGRHGSDPELQPQRAVVDAEFGLIDKSVWRCCHRVYLGMGSEEGSAVVRVVVFDLVPSP